MQDLPQIIYQFLLLSTQVSRAFISYNLRSKGTKRSSSGINLCDYQQVQETSARNGPNTCEAIPANSRNNTAPH